MNDEPTIKEMVIANIGSYAMSKTGSLESRLANANNDGPEGYEVQPQWTDKNITTYKQKVEPFHHLVVHRGTDLHADKKTVKADLKSDWNILSGNVATDALHKKRMKRTEAIVQQIRGDGDGKIFLTGSSLGGSTVNYAVTNSQKIRNHVTQSHTFNGGSTPIKPKKVSKALKDELQETMTHHHVRGDEISAHARTSLTGKHILYDSKKTIPSAAEKLYTTHIKPALAKSAIGRLSSLVGEKLYDTLKKHSLKNWL
jgi:dienelactone hydrolase